MHRSNVSFQAPKLPKCCQTSSFIVDMVGLLYPYIFHMLSAIQPTNQPTSKLPPTEMCLTHVVLRGDKATVAGQ